MGITNKRDEKIISALVEAAENGTMGSVPKECLAHKYMAYQDSLGMHLVHIAANKENLHTVPKEFLTPEIIMAKDSGKQTVLHYAATFGQINLVPKEILTEENLLEADAEGNTVYHYLANYGYLNLVRSHLLTEKAILTQNEFGRDVLDMSLHAEYKENVLDPSTIQNQTHLLTKKLSTKALENLLKRLLVNPKKTVDKEKAKLITQEIKKRVAVHKVQTLSQDEAIEI
jgi:hypothetical protein